MSANRSNRHSGAHPAESTSTTESSGQTDATTPTQNPNPATAPYNTEASSDYRAFIKDLRAGDIGAAQEDYTKLQSDLRLSQGQSTHVHAAGAVAAAAVQSEAAITVAYNSTGTAGNVVDVTV